MKAARVVEIAGDGIGPEIMQAVKGILAQASAEIEWLPSNAGEAAFHRYGDALPIKTVELIKEVKLALKGPLGTPMGARAEYRSANVRLRKLLNLYASVRPVRSIPRVASLHTGVDLVIVRENTEDLYGGIEYEAAPGVYCAVKIVTTQASERIANFAFSLAAKEKRRLVTAVAKPNINQLTDGAFFAACERVALTFPQITFETKIVDAAHMAMVIKPQQFDVVVTTNLYGDIISDTAAGLVGGLGLVPGANLGDDIAVFESVHGTAPDIAGKDMANPTALLLSALLLLRHIGQETVAERIEHALERSFADGQKTRDLGGSLGTQRFAQAIIERLA